MDGILDQIGEFVAVEWPAEEVALTEVAAEGLESLQLGPCLDAIRYCLHAERTADLDYGPDDARLSRRVVQRGDERAVDLDVRHGEVLERGERGVAGSEVVDCERHSQRADGMQALDHRCGALHQQPLRELEGE